MEDFLVNILQLKNLDIGEWDPPLPSYYNNISDNYQVELSEYPDFSKRQKSFKYEDDTRIPMIGKFQSENNLEEKLYFIDD